jgi:hypothetical protein
VDGRQSSKPYWKVFQNSLSPFKPSGFEGSCRFPQITKDGLDDSWQHGRDLHEVYHDMLGLLPTTIDHDKVRFRVTTNVITSQVAGMLINGMYGTTGRVPLAVEVGDPRPSLHTINPCTSPSDLKSRDQPTPWSRHTPVLTPAPSFPRQERNQARPGPTTSSKRNHFSKNLTPSLASRRQILPGIPVSTITSIICQLDYATPNPSHAKLGTPPNALHGTKPIKSFASANSSTHIYIVTVPSHSLPARGVWASGWLSSPSISATR